MKKAFKSLGTILKDSFSDFGNDRVLKFSASLAYYTIFSVAPMLVIVIGLCSIFLGKDAIEGKIFYEMKNFIGADGAKQIQDILAKTTINSHNILATIIGFVTLLIGATGVFGEIQDSINAIWGLRTKPKAGIMKVLMNRLMSFSMIIALGFILLVSLGLNALMSGFLHKLHLSYTEGQVNLAFVMNYLFTFITIAVLFGCIFKVLPDAKIKWRDVFAGSIATAILFMVGKFAIGFYMQKNTTISSYGAAGSLIVILLWVYYSAIILYFGAEFTKNYVKFKGRHIEPDKYAVWVQTNEVVKDSNTKVDNKTIADSKKAA